MVNRYGECDRCEDVPLQPVWFKETEYAYNNGGRAKTGRTKMACSHLECPICSKKVCVDDSFDMPWSR